MGLEGNVAFVSGSGRGIGREIALELARRGLMIAVNGRRDGESLRRTVAEIEALGSRAMAVLSDVTVPAEVDLMLRRIRNELGEVGVLVNNVGDFLLKPLMEVTPEDWEYIIASNLHSAFFVSRAVAPGMIANGWGRIVNIGLAGADLPGSSPRITPYAVAKTALWAFTKCLAKELAGAGITVNMVAPGVIESPGSTVASGRSVPIPAGRPGKAHEVARAVSFLVEEASSYITGTCIHVSGGWESSR